MSPVQHQIRVNKSRDRFRLPTTVRGTAHSEAPDTGYESLLDQHRLPASVGGTHIRTRSNPFEGIDIVSRLASEAPEPRRRQAPRTKLAGSIPSSGQCPGHYLQRRRAHNETKKVCGIGFVRRLASASTLLLLCPTLLKGKTCPPGYKRNTFG